ncbi:conserved oligomeric Golgi complex subunit 1 [Amborella trichopoda]|nr:conserved oligomeric Golgi complex subunit 1 [Amborella trichopoda]|eukprot:XP_006858729.2 conserved oligomeric Golgi complex subunit 1 [Amborella trichopoda]
MKAGPAPLGIGSMDAETLFCSKAVSEIRTVEANTRKEIEAKKEDLRQLVGTSYRDLLASADSIIHMRDSCLRISQNLKRIDGALLSLNPSPDLSPNPDPNRTNAKQTRDKLYSIASRVKYLVDTPENIWGCLDECMFLEAAGRYLRARAVYDLVANARVDENSMILSNFPLLKHQWQLVESFRVQISQRSRDRLLDQDLNLGFYADALSATAIIDDLHPKQVLTLFFDSRRTWVSQKLSSFSKESSDRDLVSRVFCNVIRVIQVSLWQVGELFLQVLNDMPLFYETVLGTPPGSQLFGGIPNPDEEVRLWKLHRERLETVMVILPGEFVAETCLSWVKSCADDIGLMGRRYLNDVIKSGEELSYVEKCVRETLEDRGVLEGSLDWLRSVFGSEIESPWQSVCELVLKEPKNLWEEMLEPIFVERMKEIVHLGFEDLERNVNIRASMSGINEPEASSRMNSSGGVWFVEPKDWKTGLGLKSVPEDIEFHSCLNAYFGPEVGRIRDAVDQRCKDILEDLLHFFQAHNLQSRMKELSPYLQSECYKCITTIVKELEQELEHLYSILGHHKKSDSLGDQSLNPSVIIERTLFIGRLLFALRNHSSHIPLILGSPRLWVLQGKSGGFHDGLSLSRQSKANFDQSSIESPRRQLFSPRSGFVSPFAVDDASNLKLEELSRTLRELCVKAHGLWISWVSDELSTTLAEDLQKDDVLSETTSMSGWEETVMKQEQPEGGPLEIKIALPSMPSLYVTAFLFQVCQEIHRTGGHVLDKFILHNLARNLLEKVLSIYENFLSNLDSLTVQVTEKGVLQVLFDLRFISDILSGGGKEISFTNTDSNAMGTELLKKIMSRPPNRRKPVPPVQPDSATRDRVMKLLNNLSERLDPIDWATYEPYLWENAKQSYQRHAVLFGFLVQLNRMYTDTVQKLPTNAESNILRCATIPRFLFLPIGDPVFSSRGTSTSTVSASSDELSSRSSWKAYSNGELSPRLNFDDNSNFGATPLLKSLMSQVGSKFGEGTLRLGSMLTDSQVGRLKDRSAAAMSTFGDMLPAQAAGLLSSFTAGTTRYDS